MQGIGDPLYNNSHLNIYEDQNGALLYPKEKKDDSQRSKFIVDLYSYNVALLLTKEDESVIIYCHIMAKKGKSREFGLYIVYKSELSDKIFKSFEEDAKIALDDLEFKFQDVEDSSNDIFGNNIIFKKISNFDSGRRNSLFNSEEMRLINDELSNKKMLTYSGGNENSIPGLIGSFLEKTPKFSFCISPIQSETSSINIKTDFRSNDLNPTGNTKNIIETIKNQIKEKEEKERKANAEKLKEEAFSNLKNAINKLESRGCNNSSILNHLYSDSYSSDSPIGKFIQILVKSECNINERKLSENEKSDLTKELIRLFKDPQFRKMLDDDIITNQFIKHLSQNKVTEPQGVRLNDSKKSINTYNTELHELDNAVRQLQPYGIKTIDIITFVSQYISPSSPIDQFVKIAVYSDNVLTQKKTLVSEKKSELTHSFVDLFQFLNSKNMIDWKIIKEDEHIKNLVKKNNTKNDQNKNEHRKIKTVASGTEELGNKKFGNEKFANEVIEQIKRRLFLENQIKETNEKQIKEKAEKKKEKAFDNLENAINELKSRGYNNSSILNHLYSYSDSSDSLINKFIEILVDSECNYNERKRLSDDEKIYLTNEFIRLFKDPDFGKMLDDRIITNQPLKHLLQTKEIPVYQGVRRNENRESTNTNYTEFSELDNAVKQLQPYGLNSSDIITYVSQNTSSSSPIDQFMKIAVYSHYMLADKKKLVSNEKSKLTTSFVKLFIFLNSKNMLDLEIIPKEQKEEYIKIPDFKKSYSPKFLNWSLTGLKLKLFPYLPKYNSKIEKEQNKNKNENKEVDAQKGKQFETNKDSTKITTTSGAIVDTKTGEQIKRKPLALIYKIIIILIILVIAIFVILSIFYYYGYKFPPNFTLGY